MLKNETAKLKTKTDFVPIPIIDLFAGPGGLGEGFSSVNHKEKRVYDIKLSIEKDEFAHKTLLLRSFFRKFDKDKVPNDYYDVLKESNLVKRESLIECLFRDYPEQAKIATEESWKVELGGSEYTPSEIDRKIRASLKSSRDWVLIGGPPCQAYSLAGRSRVGGIDDGDHRVYLYKQYLRIIAAHQPAVFVMENVKGLLSAKVNEEKVFDWMLKDLNDPKTVFPEYKCPKYKIYSLSHRPVGYDENSNPIYKFDSEFLIKSEKFTVPQKRHRIILLGIREDISKIPQILEENEKQINLIDVIGDLPKIRSVLGRSIYSSKIINGKKKRVYKNIVDNNVNWNRQIEMFKKQFKGWEDLNYDNSNGDSNFELLSIGSEYMNYDTPSLLNPLFDWFRDEKLKGVCNHQSRSHLLEDLKRYMFSAIYAKKHGRFPRLKDYGPYEDELLPDHESATSGKFADRFRVQMPMSAATTVTSHISKDGHYFIHYDINQCRSLTVREAARIQTFPDNYLFRGPRTAQYHQVGNAVPPYLAFQIAEIVYRIFKK